MKVATGYFFAMLFLVGISSALAQKKSVDSVSAAPAVATKVLNVGTDAAFPPFAYESNKQIVGFDVEVLNAIAAKTGMQLKYSHTPWKNLFPKLLSGEQDILIAAISIWETRKKQMDFSEPYFEAVQVILVPPASKATKLADLKSLKIGVQLDTSSDEIASGLIGKTNPKLRRFANFPMAVEALKKGEVDAVIAENGFVANFAMTNKLNFKLVLDPKIDKEFYGIVVKKGSKDLLEKINKGLAAIKADGSYDRIYKKYFGAVK